MPFTPTHLLAIVPIAAIRRLRLPFSALAIGSMIPDLPMFVAIGPDYAATHSPSGVLTACLPLGLAAFLVFQSFLKQPLMALLPAAILGRCAGVAGPRFAPTPGSLGRAAVAVVLGASTHALWDSFTHRDRWGTRLLPALNEAVLTVRGRAVPGYKAFQYGSTAIGLPLLALLLVAWLRRQEPGDAADVPTLPGRWKAAALLVAILVPAAAAGLASRGGGLSGYDRLGRSITSSGFALLILALAYGLAFRAVEARAGRGR